MRCVRQMDLLIKDAEDWIEEIWEEGKYKDHGKEYKADAKPKVWRIKRSGMYFSAELGKTLCQPLDEQEFLRMMVMPDDHTPRNKIN